MGRQVAKRERIVAVSLEDFVPATHLLRSVDRFLDLSDLHARLAAFYSHTGRPSIDPELMMRMLIIGYCYGIRSERRLCEDVHLNLAYRWFCRLGLKNPVPESRRNSCQEAVTNRSCCPMDSSTRWSSVLCLLHQLLGGSACRHYRRR
jgi:transposase